MPESRRTCSRSSANVRTVAVRRTRGRVLYISRAPTLVEKRRVVAPSKAGDGASAPRAPAGSSARLAARSRTARCRRDAWRRSSRRGKPGSASSGRRRTRARIHVRAGHRGRQGGGPRDGMNWEVISEVTGRVMRGGSGAAAARSARVSALLTPSCVPRRASKGESTIHSRF
jgi:hypothetical protein